ncbi:MAG: ROK family protein [Bacillota bacterium]
MRVGIDLGGTTIKCGIVNDNGKVLFQGSKPTRVSDGFEIIVDDIAGLVRELLAKANMSLSDIISIGIGIPGIADYNTGNVIYCTNLSWENVPLAVRLQDKLGIKVCVDNDATVAALAESLFGSTKGAQNSVFLTLGTGIGGGILINGKIYSGSHGAGSEIGHMIVGENFYDCNCGKNGCLETFASATALKKYAGYLLNNSNQASSLRKMCNGDYDSIEAKMVFDAARAGDKLAEAVIDRMIKYLSIGIVNIYNLLDPDMIAIGGGVSKAGDYLLELLRKQVKKLVFNCNIGYGEIVIAELENDAGIVGAAFLE